jgi:hypothetical protein
MKPDQFEEARAQVVKNNEVVMLEMARRLLDQKEGKGRTP